MLRIVTDSTCDLPSDWYERYRIDVVPINIQFGAETYAEGVDIDHATFYRKIEDAGLLPTTSQPSVGQFVETYRRVAGDGGPILSIHVTGKLSGTTRSAEMAREQLAGEAEVHVVDSMCGSAAMGYMCVEARQLADQGVPTQEIVSRLEARRPHINIFLTLDTLEYARMSGRIGTLGAALGSLLRVKPLVALEDGLLEAKERVRTRGKAMDRLLELLTERVGDLPVRLAAMHAEAPDEAEALLARAQERFSVEEGFVTDLATSLAVHFGPGTVGLVSYPLGET